MALPLLLFLYNNFAFVDGNKVCYVMFMPYCWCFLICGPSLATGLPSHRIVRELNLCEQVVRRWRTSVEAGSRQSRHRRRAPCHASAAGSCACGDIFWSWRSKDKHLDLHWFLSESIKKKELQCMVDCSLALTYLWSIWIMWAKALYALIAQCP